jgi:hypothetical protein
MSNYAIHLPESTSPGDCLGAFGTALSAIGLELGQKINAEMTKSVGAGWMRQLEDLRALEAMRRGKAYKKSYSPLDYSWIINEAFHNSQSLVRSFLPITAYNFFDNARELVETRNRWYHDYNPHNVNELTKALELCVYIASKCQLDILPTLEAVRKRAIELKAGTYKSAQARVAPVQPRQIPDKLPIVQPAQVQRAIGAVWLGELPARRISLKSAGTLIDEKMQANVTSELSEIQRQRYLKLWQLVVMPGWLWVDELGQVAAYVNGVLRCVGFWGDKDEPPQDPFSKFLLPHSYELNPDSLIDRATGAVLNEDNIGKVTESTLKRARLEASDSELVRVTWDGDLVWFGNNGAEFFGEIESKDWFASHFSIETA